MAHAIVSDFIDNETPLANGIAKTAETEGLNPDQTKNLVQLSNIIAHLKLFDKKTGDKNIEFEPADPEVVMKKIYQKKPEEKKETGTETGSEDLSPFPDLLRMVQECISSPEQDGEEKVEEEGEETNPRKRQILIIKIRKVAEELENRTLEARHRYTEGVDKLAMEFRKLYGSDHATFEKEGSDLFNSRAVAVFNDIRSILGKTSVKVPVDNTKTACVVDSETPLMKAFAVAVQDSEEAHLCTEGVRFLNEKIGALL